MVSNYIETKNLTKSFDGGRVRALGGVDFILDKGEFVAIMGPSGCGKSTLMNIIGALDKPDSGDITVDGEKLNEQKDLSEFRSRKIGFVFQLHNLIPTLTALENVQIPMFERKISSGDKKKKARELLEQVGLKDRFDSLPTKLSGGERQRVAVARALANDPEILIADEPTGALDSKSAKELLELVKKIHRDNDNTVLMVTHDKEVASWADRIVNMFDGKIV